MNFSPYINLIVVRRGSRCEKRVLKKKKNKYTLERNYFLVRGGGKGERARDGGCKLMLKKIRNNKKNINKKINTFHTLKGECIAYVMPCQRVCLIGTLYKRFRGSIKT